MDIFQMALVSLVKDKNSCQKALKLKRDIDNHILKEQYRIAREECEELIAIIKNFSDDKGDYKKILLQNVVNLTYSIKGSYLETSEIGLGTYVNARVEFKPSLRDISDNGVSGIREGDPRFRVYDEREECYDCYIKEMPDLKVGDEVKLWITGTRRDKKIIYLEPRVEKGDTLFVKTKAYTKKGDYLFRFLSYDGFIKNEGSTKNVGMKVGANYKVRVEYPRLATKVNRRKGKIYRIGIMFAQALEEVTEKEYEKRKEKIFQLS